MTQTKLLTLIIHKNQNTLWKIHERVGNKSDFKDGTMLTVAGQK